jgi:L-asparaginase / beta-aspartyl-peptidase
MKNFCIAVHGGAGTINASEMTFEKETIYRKALETATLTGYSVLEKGGSSLDAVEAAVIELENEPLFNAGRGAVFTNDGKHEMDASIMEGKTLRAGAVTSIRNIRNPVSLARAVMEQSEYVFLCGQGAETFAKKVNLPFEPDSYFDTDLRRGQWLAVKDSDTVLLDHKEVKKMGTVGAVALDAGGNLAAATSTGGMTNKRFGRIGDSPIIGAGTYANNNTCAISCTGHGEFFIRSVVAYDISCLMEYKGLSLHDACKIVVMDKLVKIGGEGGLIAIDKSGNIELPFNSDGMYRGWKKNGENIGTAIYKE